MQIFYAPDITTPLYELSEEESRHAVRVLRLGVGSEMHLTDGRGNLYCAEVVEAGKRCIVRVVNCIPEFEKRELRLMLAVAPTKSSERWEWFVEKATETGVDVIVPLATVHSERKTINALRTEKVITEAMKQSLKAYRPVLAQMTRFEEFVKSDESDVRLIAHCRETERVFVGEALKDIGERKSISIMIGAEGDFSVEEIGFAVKHGFTPVSLGQARLRTETAALAAVTIIDYEAAKV